jgi:hypothetical protein
MKEPAPRVGAFAVDHINLAISALVGAYPALQLDPVDQSLLVAPLQVSVTAHPAPDVRVKQVMIARVFRRVFIGVLELPDA